MTSPQHMLWMLDEFEAIHGAKYPGFITGKPVGMGGSLGRTEATGYGLIYTVREALKEMGIKPEATTASVQGFGNVAQYAIQLYSQLGGKVVCVSCWDQSDQTSYTYREDERDRASTSSWPSPTASAASTRPRPRPSATSVLPGDAWIEQDVDILLPCALENQVNAETVKKIQPRVKIIAEGANGPTTPEADAVLKERGIFVIPDFLANAGGVTCSYFEQVQCNMNYFWDKDEVLTRLDDKMTAAFHAVSELARTRKLYMRDAAYVISVSRVANACKDRGWV